MMFQKKWNSIFKAFGFLGLLLMVATNGIAQVNGNGAVETQLRSLDMFTKLVVELPGEVEVVCQNLPFVEITADENLLGYIEAKVWGNELRIKATKHIQPTQKIKLKVGTAFLHQLETALGQNNYRVTNIETSFFRLVNFTSDVILEGTATELNLSMESGNCYAENLVTKNARAEIWGGGTGVVQVRNTLSGVINQSSRLVYLEKPQEITATIQNDSKLNKVTDFPEGIFAQKRSEIIDHIRNPHKLKVKEEAPKVVVETPDPKQNSSRIMLTLLNNSEERVHVYVQGPEEHPFSYEAPFNPNQKRLEDYPIGTQVFLLRGVWSKKILVTVKAEDANQVVPLFSED